MIPTTVTDPTTLYRANEYTIRKGRTTIVYFIAETSEFGCRLKPVKSSHPRGIGDGRWHAWKSMQWDFRPSSRSRPMAKAF